jgi:hypothetical protein
MKVLAAVLAVIAVASAQTFNTDIVNGWAIIGYPNNFEVVKAGGEALGLFHIDAMAAPNVVPGDGRRACMQLMGKITSPAGGSTDWSYAPYSTPEASTQKPAAVDQFNLQMTLTASARTGKVAFDITPTTNTSTGYVWPVGIAVVAKVGACSLCSKTTELTASAILGWCNGAGCCTAPTTVITWSPFLAVDDRNTWAFETSGTLPAYQPPAVLISAANTQRGPLYFFVQPDKATDSVTLVVHKQSVTRPVDPTTGVTGQTADIKVLPLGARRNGNFRSGAVPLDNAAFLAEAYVNAGGTWTVAFGFGHEPAAAAGLVPSFLLAALLAVVALLL